MEGILLVVSGPSGAGKSTVLREMMMRRGNMFFSVSATTRQPRPGEQHKREYYFVSDKEFKRLRDEDKLLEWAEYAGYCYGTPVEPIEVRLAQGYTVVLDIETDGAMQVIKKCPDAVTVYLTPPDEEEIERRLRIRGTENEDRIARRMKAAREEYKLIDRYQYIVVNDTVKEAVRTLEAILDAEQARSARNPQIFAAYRGSDNS